MDSERLYGSERFTVIRKVSGGSERFPVVQKVHPLFNKVYVDIERFLPVQKNSRWFKKYPGG
jgi:hypothetical protein